MIMNGKKAFTLAEVLITLGIIGVVAAMTMPTLMNATQGAQYRTAYKKALSVLSQAVVLNIALDDYDLSQATGSQTDGTSNSLYNLFKNRMNVVSTNNGQAWGTAASGQFGTSASNNFTFYFNDGMAFTFPKTAGNCADVTATNTGICKGAIDINGAKNPTLLYLAQLVQTTLVKLRAQPIFTRLNSVVNLFFLTHLLQEQLCTKENNKYQRLNISETTFGEIQGSFF